MLKIMECTPCSTSVSAMIGLLAYRLQVTDKRDKTESSVKLFYYGTDSLCVSSFKYN